MHKFDQGSALLYARNCEFIARWFTNLTYQETVSYFQVQKALSRGNKLVGFLGILLLRMIEDSDAKSYSLIFGRESWCIFSHSQMYQGYQKYSWAFSNSIPIKCICCIDFSTLPIGIKGPSGDRLKKNQKIIVSLIYFHIFSPIILTNS